MAANILTDEAFDQLFRKARTANAWKDDPIPEGVLEKIYEIMKFGPTSANSCPMRIIFVKSKEAKERLRPALDGANIAKVLDAPVTAIFAEDMQFYEHLSYLFPHTNARVWFEGKPDKIFDTAFRNGTLQTAYFMIVARGFGLDCGPMSGFNKEKVDTEFFPDGRFKSNFICSLGYGDHTKTFARSPRFSFDEVCKII